MPLLLPLACAKLGACGGDKPNDDVMAKNLFTQHALVITLCRTERSNPLFLEHLT